MDTARAKRRANAVDAGDRISGLSDELRQQVLSFLPARDAVRTSVLSPRWRHLWASARRLNIDAEGFTSPDRFIKFVNALLLSRGSTSLDSFSLNANGPGIFLENFRDTAYLWICHALRSNVQALSIVEHDWNDACNEREELPDDAFQLDHCPFTSSYLKKLHLCGVSFMKGFLKKLFSGCPALEDLDIKNSEIDDAEFSSVTLKNLSIDCDDFPCFKWDGCDIVINMPSLVSLHIGALLCSKPIFEDLQSLITASICLDSDLGTSAYDCNILGALSNVKELELLFTDGVEWSHWPQRYMQLGQVVFENLTSLSLSDWCLHDNCKPLLHLLHHSPNLEDLTLKILSEDEYINSSCSGAAAAAADSAVPFNCEMLRKVKISCQRGDKTVVGMLVTILVTKLMHPLEISINPY